MAGSRKQWTPDEDACMLRIIDEHGTRNWTIVAEALTAETGSTRSGKQCRTRFINHLDPHINRDPWSEEEDTILYEAHAKFGNKWAKISSLLPGRTDNQVKNHYYSSMRRTVRRIHKEVSRPAEEAAAGGTGGAPPATRMEQVISQLSEADAASFKACYGVLQQSLSGQASASSILNSDLPKCVTSAITNPPARSKRRRQTEGPPASVPPPTSASALPPPSTLPLPSFMHQPSRPQSLPPLGAALPPLSSIGFNHTPLHAVWAHHPSSSAAHALPHALPHSAGAPTAVMGPDGRLHLLAGAPPGPHGFAVQQGSGYPNQQQSDGYPPAMLHSSAHMATSPMQPAGVLGANSAQAPPAVALPAMPAQQPSPVSATGSQQSQPQPSAGAPKGRRGKKRKLASMQIATDADLDPHKLANLIPQHTPGGSLVPLRKRAHTQLLLGLLSHRSQPTEQSRLASAAQAGRYTVHHGSAFSDSESGEQDDSDEQDSSPAAGEDDGAGGASGSADAHGHAGAGAGAAASAAATSLHGQYTAMDRFSNATVQLQRTPAGALIQFVPPPLPSATGTQQMQLPGTPLDAVAQGLMHNANTLYSSQNVLSLAQLGLTPRGGNAEWDDVASQSTQGKKQAQSSGKFFPEHSAAEVQATSSAHSSSQSHEPHSAPVAPLASPLTDSVFDVKASLPSAPDGTHQAPVPASSTAQSSQTGQQPQQQLEIDEDAVREFFSLPQHLRTPTGLGALAAASSSNGPSGYILRGSMHSQPSATQGVAGTDVPARTPAAPAQQASGGAPASSSSSDRNTVATRISSKSEELLAGTAAMLGSHPKLRSLLSGRLQLQQAPAAHGAEQALPAASQGAAAAAEQDDHRDLLPSSTRTQQDVGQRSAGLARLLVSPRTGHGHITPRLLTNTTGASGMFFAGTPHTGHAESHGTAAGVSNHTGDAQQGASVMFDFS